MANKCEKSVGLLRNCLLRWEDLSETQAEMENKLVQDIKLLIGELEANAINLAHLIDDNQLLQRGASLKLRLISGKIFKTFQMMTGEKYVGWS